MRMAVTGQNALPESQDVDRAVSAKWQKNTATSHPNTMKSMHRV